MPSVSSNVKFSYNIVKGSKFARKNMASELNERIFGRVKGLIEDDKLDINDFEQGFHSVMPEDVDIRIKKLRKMWFPDCNGLSSFVFDRDRNIVAQTIEVPTSWGRIKSYNLPIVFHECRHVLDTLCNPKYAGRVVAMERDGLYTKKLGKLYEKELYHYEKDCRTDEDKLERLEEIKKSVLEFLKDKPVEHQINCVQDMRYSLETECNAYEDTSRFARKLYSRDYPVNSYDMVDVRKGYMFKEKIALLKQIGFDIIKAERERLAQRSY